MKGRDRRREKGGDGGKGREEKGWKEEGGLISESILFPCWKRQWSWQFYYSIVPYRFWIKTKLASFKGGSLERQCITVNHVWCWAPGLQQQGCGTVWSDGISDLVQKSQIKDRHYAHTPPSAWCALLLAYSEILGKCLPLIWQMGANKTSFLGMSREVTKMCCVEISVPK